MEKVLILAVMILMIATTGICKEKFAMMKTNKGDIKIKLFPEIAPKTVENFIGLAEGTKEWKDPETKKMVKKPFYDGLIFHRIIDNFMIQGGCPSGTGSGNPGYRFEDECYGKGEKITGEIKDVETANKVYKELVLPFLISLEDYDKTDSLIVVSSECQVQRSAKPLMKYPIEWYLEKVGKDAFFAQGDLKAKVDYGTLCMANSGPNTNGSQFFIVTKKGGCPWLNGKHTVFGEVVEGMDIVHTIEKLPKNKNDRPNEDVMPIIETIEIVEK